MQSDHTPILTQVFLPSTPGSVGSTLLPVTNQPDSESMRTVKLGEGTHLSPPVHVGPTQHPPRSAASVDDSTDRNSVCPEDPSHNSYSSDTGENSQAPTVVLLPSDADPTTTNDPSIGLGPPAPPLSIPDPKDVFSASQCHTLTTMLPRPPKNNLEQEIVAPWVSQTSAKFRPWLILCPSPSSVVAAPYKKAGNRPFCLLLSSLTHNYRLSSRHHPFAAARSPWNLFHLWILLAYYLIIYHTGWVLHPNPRRGSTHALFRGLLPSCTPPSYQVMIFSVRTAIPLEWSVLPQWSSFLIRASHRPWRLTLVQEHRSLVIPLEPATNEIGIDICRFLTLYSW